MSEFDNLDEVPRKVLTLFYLVDTSGSMSGAKISSLNTAIRETIPIISEISGNNPDAEIRIAALEFSTGCRWMTPEPVNAENFPWLDLEASGLTSLGEAYQELSNKLSKSHGFMQAAAGAFAPAIILMSDGAPTDDAVAGLEKLKKNNWYKAAIKVAIAIGNDANNEVLTQFTGTSEAVITVHNVDQLKKIIHTVSVTASRVGSKTSSQGIDAPETKQQEGTDQIITVVNNDPTLKGVDIGDSTKNAGTDDWTKGW